MRLRALELQGFKTFPDRTKLSFTDGITAVVGPNGSGKSNISDAIRWVLGEQSAKSLRCSRMEDVIFNGTQQRKKTGYAQVTLSIDNSDRSLQFDGDEISVTRRYYRSGSSEYLINNTAVRLQDIHELFMDTGLGRDGYSMIGQGKIDSIVSTKGEDRREIFEEAAGISRFRYKKADAERRLDKTEENLVRLRDIMTELEGRVEPLRIQSEKAKAYLAYADEKRGLEIALWLKTLDRSAMQIKEQDDKILIARGQYEELERALEALQSESEEIFQQQNSFAVKAEDIRSRTGSYEEENADKRARISVLKNDILHNEQTIARIAGDIRDAKESGESIEEEIRTKLAAIDDDRCKLKKHNEELDACTRELDSLKTDESRSVQRMDEINAQLAELAKKSSEARISYMTASSSITELTGRMEVVENTVKARQSQIQTVEHIIADYQNMFEDCVSRGKQIADDNAAAEAAAQEKAARCEEIKGQYERLYLDSEQAFRKAKMLEELERNLEGFAHSVKLVMKEAQRGTLEGIHGPVSRVIRTPSQYSTAIEIALGAAMQNIVTTDDTDAKRAIAFLKRTNGGRATFLPMSAIKGRTLGETGLEQCRGFVGIASELCSCDACYNGILTNLLGRIVIAETLDDAAEIAKRYGYRFKVVTLDGQVVNAGGSLTGGSLSKSTGLLGRAAEIESIRAQAQRLADDAQTQKTGLIAEQQALTALREKLSAFAAELSQVNEDKIKIEAEIKARRNELTATKKNLDEIRDERAAANAKLNDLTAVMQQSRREYEDFNRQITENEQLARLASGSRDEYAGRREALTEKLQDIRMKILTVEKDISSAESEIHSARQRAASSDDRIRQSNREIAELEETNRQITAEIAAQESRIGELEELIKECGKEIEKLNTDRILLEKRANELRHSERTQTAEREKIGGELARLESKRESLQQSYDEINGKLWEEYELTKREAERAAAVIEDAGKAQRRLAELKQKIRALGTVNVSAIEEYKEVSERYEFLKVQIGDVEKSKSELLRLINDLTKQMREIFIERFDLINRHFSSTFVELFGGGKASLSLSDPENVLTTGIEISVEPPGKIVSHIELLSGGEKALVAIALYFAIMKVSPAPFCVMDEIEAALDDVNVYRFAEYLRRMNDNTQFICITHRRGTMEEADVLYGVTMQDRGISKMLELRAGEVEQKLGITN